MAVGVKSGKRKGAESSGSSPVKTKKAKVDDGSSSKLLNGKKNGTNAVEKGVSTRSTRRSTRARASDFFDEDIKANTTSNGSKEPSKSKKSKGSAKSAEKEKMPTSISRANPSNGNQKSKEVAGKEADLEVTSKDGDLPFEGFSSDEEVVLDADQAAALVAGFDSDSEDSSSDDEGIALEKIPAAPKPSKTVQKEVAAARKAAADGEDEPGVLYIGRIPHGFYEHQMRAYFSQFGTITRLRLARNKKTGAPKHYGFIEFESTEVADIVARTMNKYLLFGHILQVRLIPKEQIHENLWKGANKRFKKIPWSAIQARGLKAKREREVWEKRVERESQRREKKKDILKDYGYEFDMPEVKKVQEVPAKKDRITANADSTEIEETLAIANEAAEEETEELASGGKKRSRVAESEEVTVPKKAKKTSTKAKKSK